MKTELKQLSELFQGMVFRFEILCEGLADYKSTIMKDMSGNYFHFKISVFYNDSNYLHTYHTFDDLVDMHQLFEVIQLNTSVNDSETLYHKKYK